MLATIDAPSVVPALPIGDEAIVAFLSVIPSLIDFDVDLNRWFFKSDHDPIYERIAGLRDHVRELIAGKNQILANGGPKRWKTRRSGQDKEDMEIAREYERREIENARTGRHILPSPLKHEVGKYFGLGSRSGAISKIDRGLALIERRKMGASDLRRIDDKIGVMFVEQLGETNV
jgi:hypothetical protein